MTKSYRTERVAFALGLLALALCSTVGCEKTLTPTAATPARADAREAGPAAIPSVVAKPQLPPKAGPSTPPGGIAAEAAREGPVQVTQGRVKGAPEARPPRQRRSGARRAGAPADEAFERYLDEGMPDEPVKPSQKGGDEVLAPTQASGEGAAR